MRRAIQGEAALHGGKCCPTATKVKLNNQTKAHAYYETLKKHQTLHHRCQKLLCKVANMKKGFPAAGALTCTALVCLSMDGWISDTLTLSGIDLHP